jgi:hypothetical protein
MAIWSVEFFQRDILVTETPSFRNGIATMTRYSRVARQERGIIDRTVLDETFDGAGGELVAENDCLRSACPSAFAAQVHFM